MQKAIFKSGSLFPVPVMEKPNYYGQDGCDCERCKAYERYLSTVLPVPSEHQSSFEEGREYEEGKDFEVQSWDFHSGNYMNTCSCCKKQFSETNRLWFICQSCCKGVALPR